MKSNSNNSGFGKTSKKMNLNCLSGSYNFNINEIVVHKIENKLNNNKF